MSVFTNSKKLFSCALLLITSSATRAVDGKINFSQIGVPGAMETPTALYPNEGSLSVGVSNASPYNTLFLNIQPFSWLNFNTRYTDIVDVAYGNSTSGQSTKDKSFDVSIRILNASRFIPAVSVGLIDIGGTGLFASEYLVASQRFYDFDASLGVGWGRLGARGDIKNPAALLSDKFNVRPGGTLNATGGELSVRRWFRGEEIALFGSLIWSPKWLPYLSAIIELDGNSYNNERASRPIIPQSRLNYGVSYKFGKNSSFSLSYLRGDTLSGALSTSLQVGKDKISAKKKYLPELNKNKHEVYRDVASPNLQSNLWNFYKELAEQGYYLHALDLDSNAEKLTIWQSNNKSDDPVYNTQYVARRAVNLIPGSVRNITIISMSGGMEVARSEASASLIESQASGEISESDFISKSKYYSSAPKSQIDAQFPQLLTYPTYSTGINPALRSNIGGPTRFYAGQLLLKPFATLQLTQSLSVTGTAAVNVANNIKNLQDFNSGTLPRVRSDIELYQSGSKSVYVDELEANYFYPISNDWFGRFSAGIFEEMYGGVAAEILYRPYSSRWAISFDANYVAQRDFRQLFGFRDYRVATGHVTFYYKAPIKLKGINIKLSAGRYLARDIGATLDISREFRNGTSFGVFATKTNVSAVEFGEGSFDKGIYINIPLSEFSLGLKGATSVRYNYLSRDGGQKVDDGIDLYSVVGKYRLDSVYDR